MNTNDYDLYLLEADNSTVVEITDPLALNEPSLSVAIPILGTETSFSPTSVEFVQLQHRGMSGTAVRRVQKELGDLRKTPIKHVDVAVDEANVTHWSVTMKGPHGTPYQAGTYKVDVDFTPDYPFKPPVFKFTTKVYHPNIDSDGNICIGMLKTENWKPAIKIVSVLQAVYELLGTPNPDDPLVASIADQYRTDRPSFDKTVKEYITRYAKSG